MIKAPPSLVPACSRGVCQPASTQVPQASLATVGVGVFSFSPASLLTYCFNRSKPTEPILFAWHMQNSGLFLLPTGKKSANSNEMIISM